MDPNKKIWLAVTAVLIVGLVIGIYLGCRYCGGGAGPLPIIIVRPEPSDPSNPSSNHWKIGGANADPQLEADPKLNRIAFLRMVTFETNVDDGSGNLIKVYPVKLEASFEHCSVTKTLQCHACPGGETCVTSDLEISRAPELGSDFRWFVNGTELGAKSYATDQMWRAEFCGDLVGPITVSWFDANGTLQDDPVPAGEEVKIRAK